MQSDMVNPFGVHDMPAVSKSTDDLMERGFQLAYFIFPDRAAAVQILRNAMRKLKVQRSREKKRTYWRDKNMKRKITRTVRNDGDAMQWLIYCESTHYEKQQELAGLSTERDLVVRYIKHLVQMTTSMSSFYVNVGLQRLLHNYNTSDAQRAYECLTEHYPGAEEYRRIKGVLMKHLVARFPTLQTCRLNHGELRFEAFDAQEEWADLVNDCLGFFTPWSTSQTCARVTRLGSGPGSLSVQLFGHDHLGTHGDVIEASRCHMFIDPLCYGWLSERLGLDSPHERLALPRFYLNSGTADKHQPGGSQVKISSLTREERKEILDQLAEEKLQRQQGTGRSLAVVVDGAEYARVDDLDDVGTQRCEIQEGAKLVEIWMQDRNARCLLATHWIEYTQWDGIAETTAEVALGNGRKLLLELVPASHANENAGGASILLTCRRMSRLGAWVKSIQGSMWSSSLPKFAMAFASLVAIVGILGTVKYRWESVSQQATAESLTKQLMREKAERTSLQQRLDKKQDSASFIAYRLTPEDLSTRGSDGLKEIVVSVPSGAALIILELPVKDQSTSYHAALKSFLENQEVLSENSLHPVPRNGSTVVTLAVPASLVEDRKHYVVDLYSTDAADRLEKIRFFTLYVEKQ
jgi:hypothetical protein